MDNFINIEIDIPDNVFMELSKKAHEKNITLNDLMCQILRDYVDGKMVIKGSSDSQEEIDLREAAARIVTDGITTASLGNFGASYRRWFEKAPGSKSLINVIRDGFDLAEKRTDADAGRT